MRLHRRTIVRARRRGLRLHGGRAAAREAMEPYRHDQIRRSPPASFSCACPTRRTRSLFCLRPGASQPSATLDPSTPKTEPSAQRASIGPRCLISATEHARPYVTRRLRAVSHTGLRRAARHRSGLRSDARSDRLRAPCRACGSRRAASHRPRPRRSVVASARPPADRIGRAGRFRRRSAGRPSRK